MLFKGLLWFWRNAFVPPLSHMGWVGRFLRVILFPPLVYLPGMALAFIAWCLYPIAAANAGAGPPE